MINPRNRSEMLDTILHGGESCVEVGVFEGDFSAEILVRSPKELVLVDPWRHQSKEVYPDDHANRIKHDFDAVHDKVKERFAADSRVRMIRGFSLEESPKFDNDSLDFVYIDAIHTFESCLCDIVSWYHKVKPGGWLCGHDYTGKFLGVRYAVDGFCRLSGRNLDLLTQEPWASWGIRK